MDHTTHTHPQNSWCWQVCRPSCFVPIQPDNVIADGDSCRDSGHSYGPNAVYQACEQARSSCSSHQVTAEAMCMGPGCPSVGEVTLSQCSSIAYGSCQQAAAADTCRGAANWGYSACNAQQFRSYYANALNRICREFARTVTAVNPGDNTWVQAPTYPTRPVAPRVVGVVLPTGVPAGPRWPSPWGLRRLMGAAGPRRAAHGL